MASSPKGMASTIAAAWGERAGESHIGTKCFGSAGHISLLFVVLEVELVS